MPINFGDIGILKIKNVIYCCITTELEANIEAIKLLQNINLTGKSGAL